jgi:TolB protein
MSTRREIFTLMRHAMCVAFLCAAIGSVLTSAQSQPAPPKPTGAHPAVSPDGKTIAFVSERTGGARVYLIGADGTGERALGGPDGAQQAPSWTADGRVLFSAGANGITQVFSVTPGQSDFKSIASVPGRMVALSPDGTRAAYMTGDYMTSRLMVALLAGGDARQLTDGKSPAWNYRWSPDGKKIAFTGKSAEGPLAVFVVNADGSGLTQVTRLAADQGGAQVPDWSSDGKRLTFQVTRKDSGDVWVVNADGTAARNILARAERSHDEGPRWFPDGTRVAFQSDRTGRFEVWVVNVDGTGLKQITK